MCTAYRCLHVYLLSCDDHYWLQEKKYKECYDDLSHVLRECVTHARMKNTIFCHTCICIVCL